MTAAGPCGALEHLGSISRPGFHRECARDPAPSGLAVSHHRIYVEEHARRLIRASAGVSVPAQAHGDIANRLSRQGP